MYPQKDLALTTYDVGEYTDLSSYQLLDVCGCRDAYISDFFGIALEPNELLWIYDRHPENRLTWYSLLESRDDQLAR